MNYARFPKKLRRKYRRLKRRYRKNRIFEKERRNIDIDPITLIPHDVFVKMGKGCKEIPNSNYGFKPWEFLFEPLQVNAVIKIKEENNE